MPEGGRAGAPPGGGEEDGQEAGGGGGSAAEGSGSESGGGSAGRPEGRRRPPLPSTRRRISPLDVHFSQVRVRSEFRDGRPLELATSLIRPVREEEGDEPGFFLEAPFPPIEVVQWRCKLRDEQTGRPRVDPKTGGELYDVQDRWFTLDNRRLHCLQKAAVAVWPARVEVDVAEVHGEGPGLRTRHRQLRKFRTLDRGRSVLVGGRGEGETLARWSWREAVGAAADDDPEPEAGDCFVQMRRRPRREHPAAVGAAPRPESGWQHPPSRRWSAAPVPDVGLPEWASQLPGRHMAIFFAMYALVRLALKVWQAVLWGPAVPG